MLFALLGGQVDQRGVTPQQGTVMNPPLAIPTNGTSTLQANMTPAPHAPQPGSQHTKPIPIPHVNSSSQGPPQAQPQYIPITAQYNTMWQDQMMAVPNVASHPSSNPLEAFGMGYNQQSGMQGDMQSQGNGSAGGDSSGQGEFAMMNNEDLWARLQTFYEPTPAYWGQSVGMTGPGGYVDYSGMAMGM
jgi:hypothetical protein